MNQGDGTISSPSRDLTGLQNGGALAGLLEIAFEAVIEFDSRERITYWNPAAEQMLGWTAQEALGKTPAKLFLPVSKPEDQKSRRQRQSRLKRGETLRGEHIICRKDGSALQVHSAARAVFNTEGKFTGSLAVYREISAREPAQDITRRKQYEESLRARTEEIETLLEVSPVAIFVAHDPECIRISGNPAAYRMVGLPENPELNISKSAPREERPGYRVFRAGVEVPLQDLPMQKAARLGTEVYEEELELRFEDGSQKFVYAFAKPLFDPRGQSRGAVAALLEITERKRSEQLIRENEERFRNIFDQSPIGIGVYDADGTLVNLNRAAIEMFGIANPEKLVGLKLFSSPTVRDEVRQKLRNQEQIREEVVYNFDEIRRLGFYETTKSGISYFDRIITPLRPDSGAEPFGYLSQALDITERKRAEEQLEQSKQKLSEILESIQDDFYVIDHDWIFIYANEQFTSKLGKKPEDLVGNNVWELFPRHIGKALEENFRAAMEKREIRRFEISGQYTDAWYSITAFPSSEGITILGTDVTKSKRAEAEIRASQQILEIMVKHIPVSVALIRGSDLRLQLINPAYQALAPGKEMVGYTLDELWPETGQDFTTICRRVLETGEPHQVVDELNMIRRPSDGEMEPRYFSWSLYRVQLPGNEGWGLLNTSSETTARRQVEEALRENQQQLQMLNETLEQQVHEKTAEARQLASELIKAVQRERHRLSHILHDDLQQRVYALRMQLTFLRDHLPAQNATAQKDVSDMETQLDEILMVTRNLSIDLSPPILRDEGLSHAIHWLAIRMRQRYGLPIELQANGIFALADEELHVLLFNCVRELLFNVVKHAQATQAVVDLQWVEDNLQIEVRDNGKGFAVDARPAQTPEIIGDEDELQSSSGLPTLQHQLSLFGGRLEIQSAPGAGTRAVLTVPVTGTEKET